ncbi:transcriptional regulator ATRX homolog [Anabrus simplex]|uniref:transcriptional regulator ATRX homolog n=1 Tax=Anabrus simplex TaxID=316456 RepID=UPI0035A2EA2A
MVFPEDSQLLPNREAYLEVEEDLTTSSVTYPSHSSELISTFASYLGSESYLDVTFICTYSQTIKSHKLVLASVSPFLKEIFENWEGSQSDIYISLPDISRRTMKLVLDLIYVGYISLESDEITEFRNALALLKIKKDDVVISLTSANPLVPPPKLLILDKRHKRDLKKTRCSKIVESVSLSSMYVSNTVNAEEEGEPIIDMNVDVEPGVSSKVSSVDPENDPLNVPDYYYVPQSAPVEQQKKSTNEVTPAPPAAGPHSSKESNVVKENSAPNIHTPTVQQKLSKKKSKTPSNNPKSDKKKKTLPDPDKPPAKKKTIPKPDIPNQKAKSQQNATHPKIKNTPDTAKHSRSRSTSHSTKAQHGDKLPVSVTPAAAAYPVPAATDSEARKPKSTEDQDDDPIGWLYNLKKEDLIEQLQQFDLDTSGSLSVLRSRLSHYLQHELQGSQELQSPLTTTPTTAAAASSSSSSVSSSFLNHSVEPKSVDKMENKGSVASNPDRSAKTPSLKRKQSPNDITIGLKQPRVVIRDVKNEVNLLDRMKLSSISNLYRPASNMTDIGQSGSGASSHSTNDSTKMLFMSPNQNNKLTKKPKDQSLRKLNLTDNSKSQPRRKTPVVPTSF